MGARRKERLLTDEVQRALKQIAEGVSGIAHELDGLTESGLQELASRAQHFGPLEHGSLWRGVADEAERLETLRAARRTGSGEWYAVLDVTRDDPDDPHCRARVATEHVKCSSHKEAIEAGRRMMVEKTELLDGRTSVEVSLVSALEWWLEE